MKPIIVDDWRASWRWLSVHLTGVLIVWGSLDPKTQADILGGFVPPERVPLVLGVAILVGRYIKQRRDPVAPGSDGHTTPQ
jgi:hypothetical protein